MKIYSPDITGSLVVTGSIVVSEGTIQGSLGGEAVTSSYVELTNVDGFSQYSSSVSSQIQSVEGFPFTGSAEILGSLEVSDGIIGDLTGTSSFATTASYAVSASHEITLEVSSSYAESASFAVTASHVTNVDTTNLTNVEELSFDSTGNEVFRFPVGTTQQRPTNPLVGYVRYNTDKQSIELYSGTQWLRLQTIEFTTLEVGQASASVTGQDATTLTNVISNADRLTFNSSGDESFTLPSGTEAQRPTASAGYMRYNTDEDVIEAYIDGEWVQMDTSIYVPFTQGTSFGYVSAGNAGSTVNTIDKFSFTSDANATDVGDGTTVRYSLAGQSSSENGYSSGGSTNYPTLTNIIDKFSFSADGNATDVGDLTVSRFICTGNSSDTHGYTSGGNYGGGNTNDVYNIIDKFPFASDSNASDVGDLLFARHGMASQNSLTHGYTSGANRVDNTRIEKFSYASDGNSTDVGNLTAGRASTGGQNSATHGYTCGEGGLNVIDKFTFASDANATDVGDLTSARSGQAGQSSATHGYNSGGYTTNLIEKFSFSTDENASDIADLTQARGGGAGQQV